MVHGGGNRCPAHQAEYDERMDRRRKEHDERRGSAASRGYDQAWRRLRESFLRAHLFCEDCRENGVMKAATMVHHIKSVEDFPELRLDASNLRALCHDCHERTHGRAK